MKRKRIKLPNLPATIVKQLNGSFRCSKTGKWYSWATLVRMYGEEPKTEQKSEVKPMSHEQIIEKRWDLQRD